MRWLVQTCQGLPHASDLDLDEDCPAAGCCGLLAARGSLDKPPVCAGALIPLCVVEFVPYAAYRHEGVTASLSSGYLLDR